MTIQLVEPSEVRAGRGGSKTKGEKYSKYVRAIDKHTPWIKEEIAKSKDGIIRIKNIDIRREMGKEFENKNETSVYWALKFVLFNEGIVVETGTHANGDKLLVMRLANDDDRLPASLSKYLEPAEEGEEDTTTDSDSSIEPDEDEDDKDKDY